MDEFRFETCQLVIRSFYTSVYLKLNKTLLGRRTTLFTFKSMCASCLLLKVVNNCHQKSIGNRLHKAFK